MNILIAGAVLFLGMHLLSYTPVKPAFAAKAGENGYKGLFSLVALAGLGLMIWGFIRTGSGPDAARIVYHPPAWGYQAVMPFVLLALISLVASHLKGHLKRILRNPMSVGIALWAVGHFFANGNLGEIIFFGTFLALALADIARNLNRAPSHEPRPAHDVIALAGGVGLFFAFIWLHPIIIGASVF